MWGTETPPPTLPQQQVDFLLLPFSKPASEVISEYSRKVDFLKGMLQAEKLVSLSSHPSGGHHSFPHST